MLKKSSVSCCEKQIETADRVRPHKLFSGRYENISRDLFQTLSKYLELTEDNFHVEIYRTHIFISYVGEET